MSSLLLTETATLGWLFLCLCSGREGGRKIQTNAYFVELWGGGPKIAPQFLMILYTL